MGPHEQGTPSRVSDEQEEDRGIWGVIDGVIADSWMGGGVTIHSL